MVCSLVSIYFDSINLIYKKKKKKMSETLVYSARDMLNLFL